MRVRFQVSTRLWKIGNILYKCAHVVTQPLRRRPYFVQLLPMHVVQHPRHHLYHFRDGVSSWKTSGRVVVSNDCCHIFQPKKILGQISSGHCSNQITYNFKESTNARQHTHSLQFGTKRSRYVVNFLSDPLWVNLLLLLNGIFPHVENSSVFENQ